MLIIENDEEKWALGSAYRIVHRHANKAISFLTTVDYYNDAMQMTREYAQLHRNKGVPIPPKVKMNKDNVPVLQRYLYEVSSFFKISSFFNISFTPTNPLHAPTETINAMWRHKFNSIQEYF